MSILHLPRDVVDSHVINASDHGAMVTIAAAFCAMIVILLFLCRLLVRWPWTSLFYRDDFVALAATLFALVQVAVSICAAKAGLGRNTSDMTQEQAAKAYKLTYASNLPYIIAVFTSKLIISLFFSRLSDSPNHLRQALLINCATGVSFLVSFLIVAVENNASGGRLPSESASLLARWIFVECMSATLDVIMVAFPIFLVLPLQMQTSNKIKIVCAFALRLLLIPIVIVRLINMYQAFYSDAILFHYATTEVYTQAELCYNVASGTIPCLGIFMQAANTGFLTGTISQTNYGYGSQRATKGSGARGRQSFLSRNRQKRSATHDSGIQLSNYERGETITTSAFAGEDKISMASDSSQRGIVVRQTVHIA